VPAAPPDLPRSLRCASFHSVKGGVGKSTLSYLTARLLAEEGPVALVDADLTGTSLADVLPLRAPRWNELDAGDHLPLARHPDDHTKRPDESKKLLSSRATAEDGHARFVPLLNDFLLWTRDRYDSERDVHPEALFWKLPETDPLAERLFVIPSSALPNDLAQILPLIYDELHAAYLESRLEWLLHWLLERTDVRTVVFDTPPTIPGLSRAVLSMAMRLPGHVPLSEDGLGTPLGLGPEGAEPITWTPFLVVSTDLQDLHAADRWLDDREEAEVSRLRLVINRAEKDWDQLEQDLKKGLAGIDPSGMDQAPAGGLDLYGGKLFDTPPVVVRDLSDLRIFKGGILSEKATAGLASLSKAMQR
jgi:NUBPL iron-transfer P-loop NTPase